MIGQTAREAREASRCAAPSWGRAASSLSGGEQARVLIARLMLQPADVLLLDEPANDLDIPTLEVLEDSLIDFAGALAGTVFRSHPCPL